MQNPSIPQTFFSNSYTDGSVFRAALSSKVVAIFPCVNKEQWEIKLKIANLESGIAAYFMQCCVCL